MARVLPEITREMLEDATSSHGLVFFVMITHPDLDRNVYLVTDGADYVFEGVTWQQSWFELGVLDDGENPPRTKFRFPNVDDSKISRLEHIRGPAQISFRIFSTDYFNLNIEPREVLAGAVPTPAYQALHLSLINVKKNDDQVEGTLENFDPRAEKWPSLRVTEQLAPGATYR